MARVDGLRYTLMWCDAFQRASRQGSRSPLALFSTARREARTPMRTIGDANHDEAQIRALIDTRVRAVQAKDVAAALACVDVDVVL